MIPFESHCIAYYSVHRAARFHQFCGALEQLDMSENLIIKIDENNDKQASWIVIDSAGMVCEPEAQGSLDEAAIETDGRRVIALVPGTDVLTTKVDIPAKGHKLMAALPYALEEFLAQDVEELHFAIGDKRSSGHTPVCVVSEERMEEWIELFNSHDITPTA